MAAHDVSRDFDTLSSVYDETRQPLDSETVRALHAYLKERGFASILEVGVGTGRIAEPLVKLGLTVVGVDASRGMLGRAVKKGIPYLVHGTAYRLPFPDRSFDGSLFVHVLHLLDDPGSALREAARVSRGGVLAIMDRPSDEQNPDRPPEETPRGVMRQVLADAGYPDLLRRGPRVREKEILAAYSPREVRILSDREVTEPLSKQLDNIEKRAYRHVLSVPPDILARAVAIARERVGIRTVTYRRREAVVWWPDVPVVPSPARDPSPDSPTSRTGGT